MPDLALPGTVRLPDNAPAHSGSLPDDAHGTVRLIPGFDATEAPRGVPGRRSRESALIPSGRIRRHVADCGASTGGFDSEPIGGWRSGRRSMLIGMAIRLIGTFADTAVVQRGSAWFSVVHPRYRVHSVGKTVDKPNREYPIFHCTSITYWIRSRGSGNPETPAPARTRHPRTTGPGSPESHE